MGGMVGELPAFKPLGKSQGIFHEAGFVQQHQRPARFKQPIDIILRGEFGGVAFNPNPSRLETFGVHIEQTLVRFFFWNTVGVNHQTAHVPRNMTRDLKPLLKEQLHEPRR